jgi:hypothetical protein
VCFTQANVEHAGNCIGAVLRRRAVAQHFDRLHHAGGQCVEVDGGGAAADCAVDVDERCCVASLAVDQYQRLIGGKAAQRCRADRVGAVGKPGPREIERGQRSGQRLVDLDDADILQLLGRYDVHRNGGVECRAIRNARTGHDDLFERLVFLLLRLRLAQQYKRGRRNRCDKSTGSVKHGCSLKSIEG